MRWGTGPAIILASGASGRAVHDASATAPASAKRPSSANDEYAGNTGIHYAGSTGAPRGSGGASRSRGPAQASAPNGGNTGRRVRVRGKPVGIRHGRATVSGEPPRVTVREDWKAAAPGTDPRSQDTVAR